MESKGHKCCNRWCGRQESCTASTVADSSISAAGASPVQPRNVTAAEDAILRAATLRAGTLVSKGRLVQPSQALELSDEEIDAAWHDHWSNPSVPSTACSAFHAGVRYAVAAINAKGAK